MSVENIYEQSLSMNQANFAPLTPLSFLERSSSVYPDRPSVIHGDTTYTWAETYARSCRLASALSKMGVGEGDTVSFMGANTPETFEAHFGVPMTGAVLNALNVRLDAKAIAFILQHAETKVQFTDREYSNTIKAALELLSEKPVVIDIDDPYFTGGSGAFATMHRTEKFKLVVYHDHGLGELFDLETDPWEFNNLWDDPNYESIKNQLILESFNSHVILTTNVGSERIAPM